MKLRKLLFGFTMLTMLGFSSNILAQFEGHITMNLYGEVSPGKFETSEMNLYSTGNRIFLRGEESVSVMDGLDASGLLIRNDKKDFVVLMGENKALQFTKEELEGIFQMVGMMSGDKEDKSDLQSNVDYRYTDKTKTIQGFESTELLIESNTDEISLSIWLTSEIDINWGMLAEPWKNAPENTREVLARITQEFKSSNFPMLVQMHDKGKTETIFEVTNVNKSSIAKAMVEIPSGVNLIGLQEFIFSMMMGN